MNQYIIALVIANVAWFGFVVMILNAFHRLRLKYENEIDVLNHKRNQESEAAERVAGFRRDLQKLADERALKIERLTKQVDQLEMIRDKYVEDVVANQDTIAKLKKEQETYETTYNDMNRIIGERDASIHELEQKLERITLECSRRANEVVKLQRSCDQHRAEETRLSKLVNEANARTRDSDIAHDAIADKFARLRKLVSESIRDLRSQIEENSK